MTLSLRESGHGGPLNFYWQDSSYHCGSCGKRWTSGDDIPPCSVEDRGTIVDSAPDGHAREIAMRDPLNAPMFVAADEPAPAIDLRPGAVNYVERLSEVPSYWEIENATLVEFAEFKGYKLGPWMKQQLQEIEEAGQRGLPNKEQT